MFCFAENKPEKKIKSDNKSEKISHEKHLLVKCKLFLMMSRHKEPIVDVFISLSLLKEVYTTLGWIQPQSMNDLHL